MPRTLDDARAVTKDELHALRRIEKDPFAADDVPEATLSDLRIKKLIYTANRKDEWTCGHLTDLGRTTLEENK